MSKQPVKEELRETYRAFELPDAILVFFDVTSDTKIEQMKTFLLSASAYMHLNIRYILVGDLTRNRERKVSF